MILLALLLAQEPAGLEVTLRDGLKFRSTDGTFQGYLGGRLRVQERYVLDRPDDETAPLRTVSNGPYLRLARIEVGGTLQQDWSFRLQVDGATGTFNQSTGAGPSSTGMTFRDAWLEWRRYPEAAVRVGQFFEPSDPEDMDGSRVLEFVERSVGNRLAPGRQAGLQLRGDLLENALSYYLMVTNGNALLSDQGRSVADADDEKELAGTLFVRPLPGLRLGAGGSLTDVDSVAATAFDLVSTELSVLWLDATAGTFDGRRTRAELSLQASWGPAGFRAQILDRRDELDGAAEDEIHSTAFFVSASCLLTGEAKAMDKPPTPLGEWGAVEVSLRWARVRLRDVFSAGLAGAAGNTDEVSVLTAGMDWWFSRTLRLSLNAIREDYDDRLAFDTRSEDALTGFLARLQLDF